MPALQARPQTPTTGTYDLDPLHTSIEFSVRHLMIATVKGRMRLLRGAVRLDGDDPATWRVEAEIDAASIDTGVAMRDEHLRSPDFFDVAHHPTLTFVSTTVHARDEDTFDVEGDLTIRGVTRPVTLRVTTEGPIKDPDGGTRGGATATTTIDRRAWGLTYNQTLETGGVMVGDKVKVELHLEATRR